MMVFWLMFALVCFMFLVGTGFGFYFGYVQATHDLIGKINGRLNDG